MPCSSLCLSQIWLLGNTEHRSKLANSCSPGSGRQGLEENHHVAYIFYASEKQIRSFLLFFSGILTVMFTFWVHSRMLVLWVSLNWAHILPLKLFAWGSDLLGSDYRLSASSFSSRRFILHAAVRLTILKHVFFYRSLPLSEKLQPFSVYYEMKFKSGIKYPPKQAPQYFSSSSLFWIFPSNKGLLIYLPTFHLFIH